MHNWKKNSSRFTFTTTGSIVYFLTLAIVAWLMLTRGDYSFWNHIPLIDNLQLYHYMSNFCISFLLIIVAGLSNPYDKHANRIVFMWAAALLAANVLFEFVIPVLNTRDWRDAIAGVLGIALGMLLLYSMKHYSLILPYDKK